MHAYLHPLCCLHAAPIVSTWPHVMLIAIDNCAAEVKAFCTMLQIGDEVQTAWLHELEAAGGDHGVDLRSMLSTASGSKISSPLEAMRSVGERVVADVCDHLEDRDAQTEGCTVEDIAEDVDLCRFGQEMSNAELFGQEGDFLLERMRKRECLYNSDAMRRKRLTKLRVGTVEVEVRVTAYSCSVAPILVHAAYAYVQPTVGNVALWQCMCRC